MENNRFSFSNFLWLKSSTAVICLHFSVLHSQKKAEKYPVENLIKIRFSVIHVAKFIDFEATYKVMAPGEGIFDKVARKPCAQKLDGESYVYVRHTWPKT